MMTCTWCEDDETDPEDPGGLCKGCRQAEDEYDQIVAEVNQRMALWREKRERRSQSVWTVSGGLPSLGKRR